MEGDSKKGLIAAGVVIASALALAQSKKAEGHTGNGGTIQLDEATMALLEAIATGQGATLEAITGLNLSEPTKPGKPVAIGVVPNTEEIACGRAAVPALNTALRLPELEIPDDMAIVLRSWPANAGVIYIGNSAPDALSLNRVYPLIANETIAYRIKNLNQIYISGTVPGDFLGWTVEHRK